MQYKDTDRVEVRANTNLGKKGAAHKENIKINFSLHHCVSNDEDFERISHLTIFRWNLFRLKKTRDTDDTNNLASEHGGARHLPSIFFISASLSTAFGPTWAANARSPHAAVFAAGCVPPPQKLSSPPCSWPHRRFTKTMRKDRDYPGPSHAWN